MISSGSIFLNNSLSSSNIGSGWLASDKLLVSSGDVRRSRVGIDSHSDGAKDVEPLRLGECE
jgi:hypothetical protein